MRGTRVGARCVVALLAVAVVAACTPSPPPGPLPSSTITASPPETELNRQRRLDFEAAEKAYRTLRAEIDRVLIAGGAKEATATMKATAAGPYLKDLNALVEDFRSSNSRQVGREVVVWLHPDAYSESALLLNVCRDDRKVETFLGKKSLGLDKLYTEQVEARKISGAWRIWSGTSKETDTCSP